MDPELLDVLRCPRSGQPLELEAAVVDVDGGEVEYGTLTAEGFRYPVLAGIPVLTSGVEELADAVAAGRYHEATATAALGDVGRSRLLPLLDAASELRGAGRALAPLRRRLAARTRHADVVALFGDPPGGEVVGDPMALRFLAGRRPVVEGFNYFRYRFGTPRYLVALALVDALPAGDGPVLDAGCGGGHLTWALTQRAGRPVVGLDPSFAQLLSARRLAPDAQLVCGDGRSLPLAGGRFRLVLSSDVLPYVAEKAVATRELERVLAQDGQLVLTALRSAHQVHVHAGEPLTPRAWLDLAAGLPHRRLLADDAVLDRYLDGELPGGCDEHDGVQTSQTVSVVAGHVAAPLAAGPFHCWPHGRGPLAVHPLLRPAGTVDGRARFERAFPSDTYRLDNRRMEEFVPARASLPSAVVGADGRLVAGADVGPAAGEVEGLMAQVGVLALPPSAGTAPSGAAR